MNSKKTSFASLLIAGSLSTYCGDAQFSAGTTQEPQKPPSRELQSQDAIAETPQNDSLEVDDGALDSTEGSNEEQGSQTPPVAIPEPPARTPESPPVPSGTLSLIWEWPCQMQQSLFQGTDLMTLVGGGFHPIDQESNLVDLTVRGQGCPANYTPRDVVLVVDMSSSMRVTDPGCQRKAAAEALVDSFAVSGNAVRFALVTFNGRVKEKSSDFLSAEDFKRDYLGNNNDVLCEAASSTGYGSAFSAARDLMEDARSDALREVYFVTDGEPSSVRASKREASKLREVATIATLMLGSADDTHLTEFVSSKTDAGDALHTRAYGASQLADALLTLTSTPKTVAVELEWRINEEGEWNRIEKTQILDDSSFSFDLMEFYEDDQLSTLDLRLIYHDSRGQKTKRAGRVAKGDYD